MLGWMLTAAVLTGGLSSAVSAAESQGADAAWIDSCIDGRVTSETPADYRTDFYLAVNKDWLLSAEISQGYAETGAVADINEEVDEQLKGLLADESLTGPNAEILKKAAHIIGDWDRRNELGYQPIEGIRDQIEAITSLQDVRDYWMSDPVNSIQIISVDLGPDMEDATRYAVWTSAPEILQYDSAEYENPTEYGKKELEYNESFARYGLGRLGYTEAQIEDIVSRCKTFEKELARSMYSESDQYQQDFYSRVSNRYTFEEMGEVYGSFPIQDLIAANGYDKSEVFNVDNPALAQTLSDLWQEDQLENIRGYLLVHLVSEDYVRRLDRESYEEYVKARSALKGIDLTKDEKDLVLDEVEKDVPKVLEKVYLEKYDSEQTRQEITEIIQDLVAVYREMLEESTWLSEEARKKAVDKLDRMVFAVGETYYPYDSGAYDLTGAENTIELWHKARSIMQEQKRQLIGTTVERRQGVDTFHLYDVNAYYALNLNSFCILNGVLNGEAYQSDWSYEKKLGGIGILIGHEISHAFDSAGAQFDELGNVKEWWTKEDTEAFQQRVQKLVDYFSAMDPLGDGTGFNGKQIDAEATADITGMEAVLRLAKKQENFNYREFFEQVAKFWRNKMPLETAVSDLNTDSHPPYYLRVNAIVQQFDEFYEAYGIKEGDGMYLAPEDRVTVW